MIGIEQALRDLIAEDRPIIEALHNGTIPANDLYKARVYEAFALLCITADRMKLERWKAEWQGRAA